MRKRLKKEWQLHTMLVPGVLITLVFSYIPLYGLIIAFEKYNPGLGFSSPWVGFDNFKFLFAQPNFVRTIWNSFYIAFFKMVGNVIVPVLFALLLNEVGSSFWKRIFQTLIYIPNFISWVILAGIIMELLGNSGMINTFLASIGLGKIDFLGSSKIFPWTMIISDVWKGFGFGTVVYLATLTSIDPELYEAARVDGAKHMKQVYYITLPMLAPTVVLMTTLSLGTVLSAGFDQIYNLYAPIVYETGDILDTYVYRMGINQAQYSIGTAVGMFKSVVSSELVGISYILAYKFANYRIL